jgi:arabinofuranosyltransferase
MSITILKQEVREDREVEVQAGSARRRRLVVAGVLSLFMLMIMLRSAWITEDAYIMFRAIENLLNGHGPVWNLSERVQVYTCPLWMFLLSGAQFLTGEPYYTTIFMGLLCSMAAVWILAMRVAVSTTAMVLALIPLVYSKAFIDYSTSGLENSLTFLLLAIFGALFLRPRVVPAGRHLFELSLVAALAMLNRMDTILFFAPALAYSGIQLRGWKYPGKILLGFTPLMLWLVFSVVYYGFPFPNTAYAKLNTGVALYDRIFQGLHYVLSSVSMDPITPAVIAAGCVLMAVVGSWRGIMFSAGIVLYMLYTIRVGGDFMSGRFFSAPLFASALGIAAFLPASVDRMAAVVIAGAMTLLVINNEDAPVNTGRSFHKEYWQAVDANGIADERAFYFRTMGLLNSNMARFPDFFWREMGEQVRANAEEEPVVVFGNIGIYGYYAGPDVHIVDYYALSDPLLARLPAEPGSRIGHFTRELPAGYLETIKSGENMIVHEPLAEYYDALATVVKGPVFTWQRFREIVKLNTGTYDHLVQDYLTTRFVPLTSLHDLLRPEVIERHYKGNLFVWWYDEHVWGTGGENNLIFDSDVARQDTLHMTFSSPFPDQRILVLYNSEEIFATEFHKDDTIKVALPVSVKDARNWLTIRYSRWNSEHDPVIPDPHMPLSVRFHELGFGRRPGSGHP